VHREEIEERLLKTEQGVGVQGIASLGNGAV